MKKHLLACAVLSALCGTAASQSSQVSLSGVVDLAARRVSNSAGNIAALTSGSNSTSRLVVRGVEDLGGGLQANFWLEGSFAADTGAFGTGSQFWDRQSTVGLAGRFGEVRLGRDWNPAFLAWASTDPFVVVGVGGAVSMFSSGAATAFGRAFGTGITTLSRSNNAVEYILPADLGGVYGQVMVAPGEDGNAQGSYRYNGARLGYASGPLNVAGYFGNTRIDAASSTFKQAGVRGSYDFDNATVSGSVTDSTYLSSKHRAFILGVSVPVGVGRFKASYVKVDQKGSDATGASIDANDAQLFGLGYVYNLSKRTALYANAARVANKGRATFAVSGGPASIAPGSNSTGYELGLRHSF